MVQAFTGEHVQKVDRKGRMSVPADYRRTLEGGDPAWTELLTPRLVVVYGQHLKDSLHSFTVQQHDSIVARINALPLGSPDRKRLGHVMITQSQKLDVDRDGRIILPLRMRQKLGIEEGDVYFRGMGDHFEMWKSDTFKATVEEDIDAWLAEMPDGYDPLSILGGT